MLQIVSVLLIVLWDTVFSAICCILHIWTKIAADSMRSIQAQTLPAVHCTLQKGWRVSFPMHPEEQQGDKSQIQVSREAAG